MPRRDPPAAVPSALHETLVPAVYHELRRLAHAYLRRERPGHTLQATALVHEAYVRLVSQRPDLHADRAAVIGTAAHLMRQILVEYARARRRDKRGGQFRRVPLEDSVAIVEPADADLWEALDDALERLAQLSPRQTRVVELRYFGGLTIEETAAILDLSEKTVKRDWATARAWLRRELCDRAAPSRESGAA